MSQVVSDMIFVQISERIKNEKELHYDLIFNRLHFDELPRLLLCELQVKLFFFQFLILDTAKMLKKIFLHIFNRVIRAEDSVDDVGTVIFFIEIHQILSNKFMVQCLLVANRKIGVGRGSHFP